MTSQIERRAAIYSSSNPRTAEAIEASRNGAEDKRGMTIAKLAAVGAALEVLIFPQPRDAIWNILHPTRDGAAIATLTERAKHNKSILSITPDAAHPGMDKVTYQYGAYQTGTSYPAEAISPKDVGDEEVYLATYPGVSDNVKPGDTISFDVDTATGNIVPNPDK